MRANGNLNDTIAQLGVMAQSVRVSRCTPIVSSCEGEGPSHRARLFAHCMRDLADILYPEVDRIRVVMDNLATHTAGALRQRRAPPASATFGIKFPRHGHGSATRSSLFCRKSIVGPHRRPHNGFDNGFGPMVERCRSTCMAGWDG
jgi:hypothetical protein